MQRATLYIGKTNNGAPANAHPFKRNRDRMLYGTDDIPNINFPRAKKWNEMNGAERKQYLAEKKAREDALEIASQQQEQPLPAATEPPEAGGTPESAPSDFTPEVEEINVP